MNIDNVLLSLPSRTTFVSSANGGKFVGSYEFDNDEEPLITCTTANLICTIQCDNCNCQYLGESAQRLKQRMYGHRTSRNPDKTKIPGSNVCDSIMRVQVTSAKNLKHES